MSIWKAVDLSHTLEFSAPHKEVVFTSHVEALFNDISQVMKNEKEEPSEKVGKVLESYLLNTQAPLVSAFHWQTEQHYYDRFVLFGSQKYEITLMALIWPRNTFSPIHYHKAWCVFGIYEGALTETLYVPNANSVVPEGTRYYPHGAWAQDSATEQHCHKLGNADAAPVISFHIYGVSPDNLHQINCTINQ
ncbi:MAG: Cysteine dioxygenase type [Rickettsiales bacterium]|jgi:predicted metal-dependent enzyme (double-stranded beta helix superfamily)|nr:Cysteine dioxygenase type [Rickettsiales bacterium]